MAKRKITPQQIVAALHRIELAIAQGAPARSAVRSAGISTAAYYRWRDEYGGMNADQVRRLMELKRENARLQTMLERLSRVVVWSPETSALFDHGESDSAPAGRRRVGQRRVRPKANPKAQRGA